MKIKINDMDKGSNLSDEEIRSYMNFDRVLALARKKATRRGIRKVWLLGALIFLLLLPALWFYFPSGDDGNRSMTGSDAATGEASRLSVGDDEEQATTSGRSDSPLSGNPSDTAEATRDREQERAVSGIAPGESDATVTGRSKGDQPPPREGRPVEVRKQTTVEQRNAGQRGDGASAEDPGGAPAVGVQKGGGKVHAGRDRYVQAQPRQGYEHLYAYFNDHLAYPPEAMQDSVEGISTVSFTIDENGRVSRVAVTQSLGAEFDKEVLRLIRDMPPWQPATLNDRPVASQLSVPLTFHLKRIKR